MRSQKLEFFTKTVCWSFCTCPSRSVLCLCLLCGRFPCVLVSSWLWLMAIAEEKSAGGRKKSGKKEVRVIVPPLPGPLPARLRFFTVLFLYIKGSCAASPPAHSHSSCSGPFGHGEEVFPTAVSSWHFRFPFWLPYNWLFLCKQSLLLNALQLSPPSEPSVSCQCSNEEEWVCVYANAHVWTQSCYHVFLKIIKLMETWWSLRCLSL